MSTLLLRNIHTLITMNSQRQQIQEGAIYARDNVIEFVGPMADLPPDRATADRVVDARGMIVLPGLVNTHHHLYQTLTRCIAVDSGLFNWLKTLYPIWARMDAEAVYASALTGMAELILSGCTTASDHLYLFPNGSKLDDEIRAAQEIGLRFHASRGSMSLGESKGGLPPDSVVEDEAAILKDCVRVIETFHDAKPGAMTRVVVAPCSPFSVTQDLMREAAALARQYKVQLHTHLAETYDEDDFCKQMFGVLPVEYAEQVNWLGDDVWYAHSVHVRPQDITLMAHTQTGAAHCPTSNMRLASGIAPIRAMIDAGVPVGLGVDGSASNDGSHMLAEARQAMLLQRVLGNPSGLTGLEALELGTLGGAKVLGRDDIGSLEPGKCADFIGVNLNRLDYAGAQHDPQAALVFCAPQRVDLSVINGRIVVEDGQLLTADVNKIIEQHNRISKKLING
ncbi:MAG: 8-oxoguanine deaminase [Thermoflexales bacterium]|nr:8-oxoguanine deaminase [Thermoflexales bacterium]